MLLKLTFVAIAVVAVLAFHIASRPATFRVARSLLVAAPADIIFSQLEDLRRWDGWNPFQRAEPTARTTFSGAPVGVGAGLHYVGRKIGEGRMTIVEIAVNERVAVKAEFIKPFAATNRIEFTLQPGRSGMLVTWAMSGSNSFLGKAIGLVVNCDHMLGENFERGLAELKRVAEAEASAVRAAV